MKKEMDNENKLSRKEATQHYNSMCFRYEDHQREIIALMNVDIRILTDDEFNQYRSKLMDYSMHHDLIIDELRTFWKDNKWNITYKFPINKNEEQW
jgi:hypothetical protein